jgi:hypothetical protein
MTHESDMTDDHDDAAAPHGQTGATPVSPRKPWRRPTLQRLPATHARIGLTTPADGDFTAS